MVDINAEAEKTLSKLDCTTVYSYPENFNKLPVVSYYNLTEKGCCSSDNEEDVQSGTVVVDIWADKPVECGNLGIRINEIMKGDGWYREFSGDIPNPDKRVYHRTMRYTKHFDCRRL